MIVLTSLYTWLRGLFNHTPVVLTIVRRYQDAQGQNVGELYRNGVCIGYSLDSFPLSAITLWDNERLYAFDLKHDFLAPMQPNRIRVGAMEPEHNDSVRKMIARIPRKNIHASFQNRFIERVIEKDAVERRI